MASYPIVQDDPSELDPPSQGTTCSIALAVNHSARTSGGEWMTGRAIKSASDGVQKTLTVMIILLNITIAIIQPASYTARQLLCHASLKICMGVGMHGWVVGGARKEWGNISIAHSMCWTKLAAS